MEGRVKTTDFSDHVYAAIADTHGGVGDISFEICARSAGCT